MFLSQTQGQIGCYVWQTQLLTQRNCYVWVSIFYGHVTKQEKIKITMFCQYSDFGAEEVIRITAKVQDAFKEVDRLNIYIYETQYHGNSLIPAKLLSPSLMSFLLQCFELCRLQSSGSIFSAMNVRTNFRQRNQNIAIIFLVFIKSSGSLMAKQKDYIYTRTYMNIYIHIYIYKMCTKVSNKHFFWKLETE